jgi:hypothetical protein
MKSSLGLKAMEVGAPSCVSQQGGRFCGSLRREGIEEVSIEERSFVATLLWMTAKDGIEAGANVG